MIASLIGLGLVVVFDHIAAANPKWQFNSTGGFLVHVRDYVLSSAVDSLRTVVEKPEAPEKKS